MTHADTAAALAELESVTCTWRTLLAAPLPGPWPRRRRGEALATYKARFTRHQVALSRVSNAQALLPYAERCLAALRKGREPASRDLVVGVADAAPALGVIFGRRLRALGVPGAAVARFDKLPAGLTVRSQ
jgi:hypothetical protein